MKRVHCSLHTDFKTSFHTIRFVLSASLLLITQCKHNYIIHIIKLICQWVKQIATGPRQTVIIDSVSRGTCVRIFLFQDSGSHTITPWVPVLHQMLTLFQLVKRFLVFYEIKRFFNLFT
jgi:hypothetical protein